eukprot:8115868-Pyramimonas_sp.AAC.1
MPIHVNEQFVFRAASKLRENIGKPNMQDWCADLFTTVVPWARESMISDFDREAPKVNELGATEESAIHAFRRCFINDILAPLIMKGQTHCKIVEELAAA